MQLNQDLLNLLKKMQSGYKNDFDEFRSYLCHNNTTELDLHYLSSRGSSSDFNLSQVVHAIVDTPVKKLDISGHEVKVSDIVNMEDFLKQCTELNLTNCRFDDECAKALSKSLQNSSVKILKLSHNHITAKGAGFIAEILDQNSQIIELHFDNNYILEKGFEAILCALPQSSLTYLNLSSNYIKIQNIKTFEQLKHSKLIYFNISYNSILDEGIEKLASVLNNTPIQMLKLFQTHIGPHGMNSLSLGLIDSKVMDLDLGQNDIGNEGIASLVKMLFRCCLEKINLQFTKIDNSGLQTLVAGLAESCLNEIDVSFNEIQEECINQLQASLWMTTKLLKLKSTFMRNSLLFSGKWSISLEGKQRLLTYYEGQLSYSKEKSQDTFFTVSLPLLENTAALNSDIMTLMPLELPEPRLNLLSSSPSNSFLPTFELSSSSSVFSAIADTPILINGLVHRRLGKNG